MQECRETTGKLAEDCKANNGWRTGRGVGPFQVWRSRDLEHGKVMHRKKGVRTSRKMISRVGLFGLLVRLKTPCWEVWTKVGMVPSWRGKTHQ